MDHFLLMDLCVLHRIHAKTCMVGKLALEDNRVARIRNRLSSKT